MRNRFSFLSISLLLFVAGVSLQSVYAKKANWSLREYTSQMRSLQFQAESVQNFADFYQLEADLEAFPDTLLVRYPRSNDESVTQFVSTAWISNWFEFNPVLYSSDSLKSDPAIQNFIGTLKMQADYLEGEWNLDLKKNEIERARRDIMNDRLYDWGQPEEEEEETSEPIVEPETEMKAVSTMEKVMDFIREYGSMILLVVIAVLILFGLWKLGGNLKWGVKKPEIDLGDGQGLLKEEDPRDSKTMQKAAQEALEKGQMNQALRMFYLALILQLHEKDIIPYSASLTNWEYYRKMVKQKLSPPSVELITREFDETQYGNKTIDRESFLHFRNQIFNLFEKLGGQEE